MNVALGWKFLKRATKALPSCAMIEVIIKESRGVGGGHTHLSIVTKAWSSEQKPLCFSGLQTGWQQDGLLTRQRLHSTPADGGTPPLSSLEPKYRKVSNS